MYVSVSSHFSCWTWGSVTNSLIKGCKIATVSTLLVQESLCRSPYIQVPLSDTWLLKFAAVLVQAVSIHEKCQNEDSESENDGSNVDDSNNDDSSDDEDMSDFAAALKEIAIEATKLKKIKKIKRPNLYHYWCKWWGYKNTITRNTNQGSNYQMDGEQYK